MLINLHMADSNRCALEDSCLDVDHIIRALYLWDCEKDNRFVTFESLGPGGDPYPAQNAITDLALLDVLVEKSIRYCQQREDAVLQHQ